MGNNVLAVLLCIVIVSCAVPKADFDLTLDEHTAPAEVLLTNKSENAESYEWMIDSTIIGHSDMISHRFYESGVYNIRLIAYSGSKKSVADKKIQIKAASRCRILMQTSEGNMIFELYEDTPIHLHNFLDLIQRDYYDSLEFHRVIDGFMIQSGDNKTRPAVIDIAFEESLPAEISHTRIHKKGALAAARMPDEINPEKASSGTQFYIVDGKPMTRDDISNIQATKQYAYTKEQVESYLKMGGAAQLDEQYTVFGHMIEGFDVLDRISSIETDNTDRPIEAVRILDVRVMD